MFLFSSQSKTIALDEGDTVLKLYNVALPDFDSEFTTHEKDLYRVGVVLYELLTLNTEVDKKYFTDTEKVRQDLSQLCVDEKETNAVVDLLQKESPRSAILKRLR